MNFMKKDEWLLLMCHNFYRLYDDNHPYMGDPRPEYILSVEDRIRLYNVGIRTSHEQISWANIEPSKGSYEFDYMDGIINTNRSAGLKILAQVPWQRLPHWIPNEWKARRPDGTLEDVPEYQVLSMWNEEAQEHSDNYLRTMNAKYANDLDLEFFYGEWQGGEGVYPAYWSFYDDAAIQDYKKVYGTSAMPKPDDPETLKWYGDKIIQHFVRKSTILYPKFHEIWNEQQHLMDTWSKAFGNFVHKDIMREYRRLFPEACIVLLQYTYFDSSHKQDNVEFVDALREISQCETIVEAMYCGGLPTTTPSAIAHGFRGQVVRPAFEGNRYWLEDWMIDNIRVANDLWRKNYEDSSNLPNSQ